MISQIRHDDFVDPLRNRNYRRTDGWVYPEEQENTLKRTDIPGKVRQILK